MVDEAQSLYFETPAAGWTSSQPFPSLEPPLLRKKKEDGHGEKRTHVTDHELKEEFGSPAMRYKAGYRRETSYPATEYQYQYAWKPSQMGGVSSPVMAAAAKTKENKAPPLTLVEEKSKKQSKESDKKQQRILKDSNVLPDEERKGLISGKLEATTAQDKFNCPTTYDAHKDTKKPVTHKGTNKLLHSQTLEPTTTSNKKGKKVKTQQNGHTIKMTDTDLKEKSKEKQAPLRTGVGGGKHHQANPTHPLITEYRAQFDPKYKMSKDEDEKTISSVAGKTHEENIPMKDLIYGVDSSVQQKQPVGTITSGLKSTSRFSHGTEYSSNFISPVQCQYSQGSWLGAPKPDLYVNPSSQRKVPENTTGVVPVSELSASVASSWYNQVLELREKAEEYRMRGDRSHRNQHIFLNEDNQSVSSTPSIDSNNPLTNNEAESHHHSDSEIDEMVEERLSHSHGSCSHACICTQGHDDTLLPHNDDEPHCLHCKETLTQPNPALGPSAKAPTKVQQKNRKPHGHNILPDKVRPAVAYPQVSKPFSANAKQVKPLLTRRYVTESQSTPLVTSRHHLTPPSTISPFDPSPLSPPSHYRPQSDTIAAGLLHHHHHDDEQSDTGSVSVHSNADPPSLPDPKSLLSHTVKPSDSCHICNYSSHRKPMTGPPHSLSPASLPHPPSPIPPPSSSHPPSHPPAPSPRPPCSACTTCRYMGPSSSSLKPTHLMTSGIIKRSSSSNCYLCQSALSLYSQTHPTTTTPGRLPSKQATQQEQQLQQEQQDSYSISSVSLASSVSVASDILAKARQRKKFWSEHATVD